MKKFAAFAVAGLLSLVAAQPASAQVLDVGAGDLTAGLFPDDELAALESSGYPFAVGGGQTATGQFAFSAHNGPAGPSGYAVIKTVEAQTQGHVVSYCRNTATPDGGGLALFTIKVEQSRGLTLGEFVSISAFDSRQSGGTGDGVFFLVSTGPCALLPSFYLGSGPVTQGNIVVKN